MSLGDVGKLSDSAVTLTDILQYLIAYFVSQYISASLTLMV